MRLFGLPALLLPRGSRPLAGLVLGALLLVPTTTVGASSAATSTVLAVDGFSRTSSSSWRTADAGGTYVYPSAATGFSMDGSTGRLELGAPGSVRSARLAEVSVADAEVRFRVSLDSIPDGDGATIAASARQDDRGNEYRTRVHVRRDGSVALSVVRLRSGVAALLGVEARISGIKMTPGAFLWLRTDVIGSAPAKIQATVWLNGTAEPAAWQIERQDATPLIAPGGVAVRARLSTTSRQAPVVFKFDDLRVTKKKPSPAPTPAPTPTPTPDPDPIPAPALARPFAAPVTTRTVTVPSSIDAGGGTNVASALNGFIASVPDGSIISFPSNGVYRIDSALSIGGRNDLILQGHGSTLRMGAQGWAGEFSNIRVWDSSDVAIRGFTLIGNSPSPGVLIDNQEHAHGLSVYQGTRVELSGSTIDKVWGDFMEVGGETAWSDGIWYHDNRGLRAGRSGVSILAARNVLVDGSSFDRSGLHAFNIEPWQTAGGGINVKFVNNTVGSFGYGTGAGRWGMLFAAEGVAPNTIRDVVVSGNTVTDDSLAAQVTFLSRRQDITFTNNTSKIAVAGTVLTFAHIDGLTVTGNVQPLSSGSLMSISDCTDVTRQ